jgi:hypothetical protein
MRNIATDIFSRVDEQLRRNFDTFSYEPSKQEFFQNSLTVVPNLFDVRLINDLRRICYETIQATVHSRQHTFSEFEQLSQSYRSFGYNAITDNAPIIEHIHLSGIFRQLIERLTGMVPVSPISRSEQFYIVQQCGAGVSDGNWLRDDCNLSLALIIDDARSDDGGALEMVRFDHTEKLPDDLAGFVTDKDVIQLKPASGSLIVSNGDTYLHRISSLQKDSTVRTAMVFAYQVQVST